MSKTRYVDIPAIVQIIGCVYQNLHLLDNESYSFTLNDFTEDFHKIIFGRKYTWYINNYEDKIKSGLFTKAFDKNNGNAILMTKNGETWSIPIYDLREVDK